MATTLAAAADCPRCLKPQVLCVCDGIVPIATRTRILILQHPQEQDRALGTARLTVLSLENATLKIGLSWPSLEAALGRKADPKRWAALYLGSARGNELAPGSEILLLDRKGTVAEEQSLDGIDGIVLLDGTWSQAKALWWRNPWLLRMQRVALNPRSPSRYGALRQEPRRDGLSTLEAAALLLSRIEERPEIETALTRNFERLLERYRALAGTERRSKPSRDRRRSRGGRR